jgi:hypothetical protein
VVKEILDELVEKICYGKKTGIVSSEEDNEFIRLDEATQEKGNLNLSTNEIMEDVQSTHEEFSNGITRNRLGQCFTRETSKATLDFIQILIQWMINLQLKRACRVPSQLMNYRLITISRTPITSFVPSVNYLIAISKTRPTPIQSKSIERTMIVDTHRLICSRTNLDLKSRIFSLRLIMQILQTSGPIFRSSEDFLYVIKTYLCVSLSRNGVSSIPELFEMALFNFVELLDKFKAHLKIQIEV